MLKDKVFLTQTDTTIGFVSQNAAKLTSIKQRPPHKHYIRAVDSVKTLKEMTRIPNIHKNNVRRSVKTTYIMPDGNSYRIIEDSHHLLLLKRLKWCFTTSANPGGKPYDAHFAYENADVIVTPFKALTQASTIVKLGKKSLKRIR